MNTTKKIPTLVALFLLIILVGIVIFFVERFIRWSQSSVTPKKIQFSNISETSFTVSWMTDVATTGAVSFFKEDSLAQKAFDERDNTGKMGHYRTHSILVHDLTPGTIYFLKLQSKGYSFDDHGAPFYITTAPKLTQEPPKLEPAYGTIMTSGNQLATDTLVYLELDDSQLLSTLVSKSGTWIIPLNLIRTKDTKAYFLPNQSAKIIIHVIDPTGEASALTDTENSAPVPTINIGKSYDFRRQSKSQNLVQRQQQTILGAANAAAGEFTLSQPYDGALLTTFLPLFAGTGIPGNNVSIVWGITSPQGATTKVGSDGIWRFTPPDKLAPGKQSVTATSSNAQGIPIALTHEFLIFKSGTQVLGDATPSATIAPTILPTPISTPIPTITIIPTPTHPVPTTANTIPTLSLLLLGLIILGGGAFLILP